MIMTIRRVMIMIIRQIFSHVMSQIAGLQLKTFKILCKEQWNVSFMMNINVDIMLINHTVYEAFFFAFCPVFFLSPCLSVLRGFNQYTIPSLNTALWAGTELWHDFQYTPLGREKQKEFGCILMTHPELCNLCLIKCFLKHTCSELWSCIQVCAVLMQIPDLFSESARLVQFTNKSQLFFLWLVYFTFREHSSFTTLVNIEPAMSVIQ